MEQGNVDFFDELCVVLVIYKMEIAKSPAYTSLTHALASLGKSATLFIYDNSEQAQEQPVITEWKIFYVSDPSNPGVSKAYNEGFKRAKALGKKWLLLADQDTDFPVHALEEYRHCTNRFKDYPIVPVLKDSKGIVSPCKFYFGGGQRIKSAAVYGDKKLGTYFFHNSGILLPIALFEKAGWYDQNLPIDFSDFSFVIRLKNSVTNFVVANIVCHHALASSDEATLHERLKRFESYITALRYFNKKYMPWNFMLLARGFLRAIKFSFTYSSFKFISSYFRIAW